ncbi:MAG: hypothetical protein ABFD89_06570, partial [Bryobacteraceae bacterium]
MSGCRGQSWTNPQSGSRALVAALLFAHPASACRVVWMGGLSRSAAGVGLPQRSRQALSRAANLVVRQRAGNSVVADGAGGH